MQWFKNILLVAGGTGWKETSLKRAVILAKSNRAQLTVSRSGNAGFIVGNTAEMVLQQVDYSVLTVKPDGFVSPITL